MNQKIFARSHYNLYYQRSLRQLFEIDCISFWKKWVYKIKSSKGFLGKSLKLCWAHRNTFAYHQQCSIKTKVCLITLQDLKNAFGEVNHQLLIGTVKLHHVPDDFITLILSLYFDYGISILRDSFMTSPIRVHRGVLQDDSLSPLLFNLIINTLINTIKSECMGCFYQNCPRPKHLFQFADDNVIVTAPETDNQHLCNVFLR